MKGGITSGVVYPAAILRIAQRFRFKNIGGTSAGAIAATITAAAEFRRTCRGAGGAGFVQMRKDVMEWIGRGKNLQSLFVPRAIVWPIFFFLLYLIGLKSALRRPAPIEIAKVLVAGVLGLAVLYGYIGMFSGHGFPYADIARIVAVSVTLIIGLLALGLLLVVPRMWHGLCTGGIAGTLRGIFGMKVEPLNFWLARQIDSIAAMPAARPLTFGDLWCGKVRKDDPLPEPGDRCVSLSMITTCLTMNRPFRLPFENNIFYFRAPEFERFFPKYVVDWMVAHERPVGSDDNGAERRDYLHSQGYTAFPKAQDVPVVVAARLSLSFPLLFTAVRLYAIDWNDPNNNPQTNQKPKIEAVWFSDGGLSSNFPISLFDATLPRWPTLAITLEEFPPYSNEPVVMPIRNGDGIGSIWTRFDQKLLPFYGAIINSMQNWQDTMQSEMAGSRDRIAHIRLSGDEGGLNLTMPPATIAALIDRGDRAGAQLVEHFKVPPAVPNIITNWDNHRWVRFRTATATLQRFVVDFSDAYGQPSQPGAPDYPTLILVSPSYQLAPAQQPFVAAESTVIQTTGVRWKPAKPNDFETGSPRPLPSLQVRPRI